MVGLHAEGATVDHECTPVGEQNLVIPTEHSYGDLLPEPGNAPRPEPSDIVSERLRDRVAGNGT